MKSLAFNVLRQLADGEFHSGAALARTAGMSRASVWHAVQEIEDAGLDVFRIRGRGYRLARPASLLDAAEVAQRLGDASPWTLEILDRAESTNTLLVQRASAGAAHAAVIAAEWQTAGRGRMQRPWHAGPCGAVTFSVLWRFTQGASALSGLSLAVGVATARALTAMGAAEIGLKWPNDVLWHGKKIAGILVEMQGDALGPSTAVIGIGVNVRLSGTVGARIDQAATDLETVCARPIDRNALLATLLIELRTVLTEFGNTGFAPLRPAWQRLHVHQGGKIALTLPDGARQRGIARGVAEDGALLLQTTRGLRRFHSGEINVSNVNSARTATTRMSP